MCFFLQIHTIRCCLKNKIRFFKYIRSMEMNDRTFELCCKNGNPNGIRVISDYATPFTAYIIPRRCMSESKKVIPADKSLGIYFLFDDARSKVYVGQTRKGIERIETHNKEKDFWSTAIMFLAENKKWKPLIDELELYATIKAKTVHS